MLRFKSFAGKPNSHVRYGYQQILRFKRFAGTPSSHFRFGFEANITFQALRWHHKFIFSLRTPSLNTSLVPQIHISAVQSKKTLCFKRFAGTQNSHVRFGCFFQRSVMRDPRKSPRGALWQCACQTQFRRKDNGSEPRISIKVVPHTSSLCIRPNYRSSMHEAASSIFIDLLTKQTSYSLFRSFMQPSMYSFDR